MVQPMHYTLTLEEVSGLQQLRASILDFREMVALLSAQDRSPEHNQQFNELRQETHTLLKGQFVTNVPKAITGDATTDRSINIIVIFGVILALLGLGINAIVLDDVVVNSLGCCVSSGGMLLVIAAFAVLATKNARQRVSTMADLRQRSDLLLYQIDHRLKTAGVGVQ